MLALTLIFWLSLAGVTYAYAAYPLIIALLSRLAGNPPAPPIASEYLPPATLLISAYNEESVIADRLHDALALDYPAGQLRILVVSDGSSDRTVPIVADFAAHHPTIQLIDCPARRGKATALNTAMQSITTPIVLLSDANTHFDPAAARHIAAWFIDPAVTAVCGRLTLTDPVTGKNVDGLYWKYETFLKKCEARLGGLLGANGAIYAIRRDRFVPIPANTIVDDFVIPLLAKLHHGGTLIYDASATATEESAPDVKAEFKRRSRIGAGGFQAIALLWPLLNPARGWVAFTFFSHKLLRWLCPFFLIAMLVANLLLVRIAMYQYILIAQLAFYALSFLVNALPARSRLLKPLRLAPMFTSMNAALLVGFFRWITNRQNAAWSRTTRLAEAPATSGGGVP